MVPVSIPIQHLDEKGRPIIVKPFAFAKLPYLAQRHIFLQMGATDVYLLTLFCPQYISLARSMKWYSEALDVEIFRIEGGFRLSMRTTRGDVIPIIMCTYHPGSPGLEKVCGEFVTCCVLYNNTKKTVQIACDTRNPWWFRTLRTHFQLTLGRNSGVNLSLDPEALMRKFEIPESIISTTINRDIYGLSKPAVLFDSFFENYTVHRSIFIKPEIEGGLGSTTNSGSVLLCTLQLKIRGAKWFGLDHLQAFKGRHLVLRDTIFKAEELFRFLTGWMISKPDSELESVVIYNNVELDPIEISGAKTWDASFRPARFESDSEFASSFHSNILDCHDALDIERVSDEKLASYKLIGGKLFTFFVWKNTGLYA